MRPFPILAAALLAVPLAACATYGDAPADPVQPFGTPVHLGETVAMGDGVTLTPTKVYEDSRCPTGVQCVWGGRVVVTTRLDGPGWRETVNLVSGEQQSVRGHDYLLIEVSPSQRPQSGIPPEDYRFAFRVDYRL